jgi:hypothetical protein
VLVVAADGHVARDVGDAVVAMPSHEMQPILPQALIDRLAVPSGIDMLLVQHQLELPGIPGPVHGWFAARSLRLHRVSGFGWRLSRTAEIDVHEALPAAVKTFAPTAARSRLFVRAFGAGDTVLEHERLR